MFEYNGKQIETDAQGYLLDYTQWEEGMIEILAQVRELDPKKEGLLYAGTENGMYISFNDGITFP